MKKFSFKRVFALLLAAVMLLGVAPIKAKAAVVTDGKTITVKNPRSSMTIKANSADTLTDAYPNVKATDRTKVLKMNLNFTYTQNDRVDADDRECGRIFPITVSDGGTLYIDSDATTMFQKNVDMAVYYDAACDRSLASVDAPDTDGTIKADSVSLPNAGTYYLKVESYSYDDPFTNSLKLKLGFFSNESMTMYEGEKYYIGTTDSDRYFKFTLPSTKYVTFYGSHALSFNLCNSKKSVIYDYQHLKEDEDRRTTYRLAKGTYYIKTTYTYNSNRYYSLMYKTTSTDPSLKNKSFKTYYSGDYDNVTYFKFKPTVSGYISVYFKNADNYDYDGRVAICSSKKKALSEAEYVATYTGSSNNRAVFGVKKNTTYYLKVTGTDGRAAIKFIQTSVTRKAGSSRSSAKSLSRNKYVKGYIAAGDSTADWYKISLKKTQTIKVSTKGICTGQFNFMIYNSKGKVVCTKSTALWDDSGYNRETWDKFKKGTYYIKIYRDHTKSNGYYSMKWS